MRSDFLSVKTIKFVFHIHTTQMRASRAKILTTLTTLLLRSSEKTCTPKFKFSRSISSFSDDYSSRPDTEHMLSGLNLKPASELEDLANLVSERMHSILHTGQLIKKPDPQDVDTAKDSEKILDILSKVSHSSISLQRKWLSHERKRKSMFELEQLNRFGKIVAKGVDKLGAEVTIEMFYKLGRKPGVKDYNILVGICIDRARETEDKEVAIQEMAKAFRLFKLMRKQGLQLEEKMYRPLLLHIIDKGMVHEFQLFIDVIKDKNPSSVSRLGYYEMMLWLRVNNEEKIQNICNYIAYSDDPDTSNLQEDYLLALCESDRKKEILQLLEIVDIKKLSSTESKAKIFQSLGRLLLESVAEKFLLDFKICDKEDDNITIFIASYAVSIPNLVVEDVITKFKELHHKLKVSPSSSSYEKLILHSCNSHNLHLALDLVDEMCEGGFTLSTDVLHFILQVCEETREYNLAHRIYSTIRRYNLESNEKTFCWVIVLLMKTKDIESAYKILDDLEEMNLKPNVGIYNAMMAECFREKNVSEGLRIFEHMRRANVKPDLQTLIYLISNSKSVEDIDKYYEELRRSGFQATRKVATTLINAYAARGQFEKAKQVVLDPCIPVRILNEIKSVLVKALASHGQLSEALLIYDEMKQAGQSLEPKALMSLIEHTQSDGELDRLLLLLEEFHDPDYWIDGCCRIIIYCVRNKHLSSALDLCKQLKDKFPGDERAMEVLFPKVISLIEESESTHSQSGLDLLWEMKDKLGLLPSRKRS